MTIERQRIDKRLSDVVINHTTGTIYLAGMVADDPRANITDQTCDILSQIDARLGEAGSNRTCILSATIYLRDMQDFAAMNAAWDEWVVPGHTPARATVEARMANPEYKIEIVVVAAVASQST